MLEFADETGKSKSYMSVRGFGLKRIIFVIGSNVVAKYKKGLRINP